MGAWSGVEPNPATGVSAVARPAFANRVVGAAPAAAISHVAQECAMNAMVGSSVQRYTSRIP